MELIQSPRPRIHVKSITDEAIKAARDVRFFFRDLDLKDIADEIAACALSRGKVKYEDLSTENAIFCFFRWCSLQPGIEEQGKALINWAMGTSGPMQPHLIITYTEGCSQPTRRDPYLMESMTATVLLLRALAAQKTEDPFPFFTPVDEEQAPLPMAA